MNAPAAKRHRPGTAAIAAAVARRSLQAFFTSGAAYVFITIFTSACALFLFGWNDRFFLTNAADLATLNDALPYLLLLFIGVLSMSSWSEERKLGTEEYLLTLPVTDSQILLGKYLGLLLTYAAALSFSLVIVFTLCLISSPDIGLVVADYFAYLLLGAAMLAAGLLASTLTSSPTVAFILSVVINAAVMFGGQLTALLEAAKAGRPVAIFLERIGIAPESSLLGQFKAMTSGAVSIAGVCYFIGLVLCFLYLAHIVLAARLWRHSQAGSKGLVWHYAVRTTCAFIALFALHSLCAQSGLRLDLTSERIYSLHPSSRDICAKLEHPVLAEVFVSHDMPDSLETTRRQLISTLRELASASGGKLKYRIHEVKSGSPEAQEAQSRYNITPRQVSQVSGAKASAAQAFLGIAFTSGSRQDVLPFLSPALPAEYELVRSLRAVATAERKKIGILRTGADMNGGMDMQAFRPLQPWTVVSELSRQYDIVDVNPTADYPKDLDVLIAGLPHTLDQQGLDRLREHILHGGRTLLLTDNAPYFNFALAPSVPPQPNPMTGAAAERGDYSAFLQAVGLKPDASHITGSDYNPHPQFAQMPKEFLFLTQESCPTLGTGPGTGLSELILLYCGQLAPLDAQSKLSFTPLLSLRGASYLSPWSGLFREGFGGFGGSGAPEALREDEIKRSRYLQAQEQILAARLQGPGADGKTVDLLAISDIDFISNIFFDIRAERSDLKFDNVEFFMNALDALADDESMAALRAKRRVIRSLTYFDKLRAELTREQQDIAAAATAEAEIQIQKEETQFQKSLSDLAQRTDLQEDQKEEMAVRLQQFHQRRLLIRTAEIKREAENRISSSSEHMDAQVDAARQRVVLLAIIAPSIMPLLLAAFILVRRRRREMSTINAKRTL